MEAPRQLRSAALDDDGISITRREHDGEETITIDFGPGVDAKLDVVGDTAIVVAGDEQFEFEIPPDASDVTANDGMVMISG